MNLTKADFLSTEEDPVLASMLAAPDGNKKFEVLETVLVKLNITHEDLLGNDKIKGAIAASSEETQAWLMDHNLLTEDSLFECLLGNVSGSELRPVMQKFLTLVHKRGTTRDEVLGSNPDILSSIFASYWSTDDYPDVTGAIIQVLNLTKADFLSTEGYPVLATMLLTANVLSAPDANKKLEVLETVLVKLDITREDLLSNASIKNAIATSSEQTEAWLMEHDLLTEDSLFECLLGYVNGTKLSPAMQKFLTLIQKRGTTRDEVLASNPDILFSIFSRNWSTDDYPEGLGEIIQALNLTKADFLSPEDYHPLLECMLSAPDEFKNWERLEAVVNDFGITRRDFLSHPTVRFTLNSSSDKLQAWIKEHKLATDDDIEKISRFETITFEDQEG